MERPSTSDPRKPHFGDHLATADSDGRRQWLYPKQPQGRFYQARAYVSWALLAIMFAGPFIRVNGNPLLMINILERKFVILGRIFWPQDTVIFAVAMLCFLTGIIVFTAVFGRLWCGWTCPQTLLMEMVFRRIEYWIEGDSVAQRALDKAPWTAGKLAKKGAKHAIFFGLSFVIGNTLFAYIVGSERLIEIITDNPANHRAGLTAMIAFTLLFYAIFARFREQACTFICPYGRFQSTLLDKNSLVVAYDHKRGEPRRRGRPRRDGTGAADGAGDCVDCGLCVAVCPTGIDIRDGIQMECVNCAACIDACHTVMQRVCRPTGLIRYASVNGIERGEPFRVTPRIVGYSAILCALIALFLVLALTRSPVEASLLRAPGALYQEFPQGEIGNLYTLGVANKTSRDAPLDLRLESPAGRIEIQGGELIVPAERLAKTSVLVKLPREAARRRTPLVVGVYFDSKRVQTIKTSFVGPDPGP